MNDTDQRNNKHQLANFYIHFEFLNSHLNPTVTDSDTKRHTDGWF